MSDYFQGNVNANGIRIHYWRTGATTGKPVLILQHGFNSNGRCWHRVAREFEGAWDVIMPDARGHGLTEAPDTGYSAGDMAADLAGFCKALYLPARGPVILGHSMGGRLLGALAAEYPDVPRAAIFVDPGWSDAPRSTARAQAAVRYLTMTLEQLQQEAANIHPDWSLEDREAWVESRRQMSEAAATQVQRAPVRPWRDDVRRIQCPALLMTADVARGAIVTPEAAAEAQQINPFIQVLNVADSGHDIYRDNFVGFVAALKAFLATLS